MLSECCQSAVGLTAICRVNFACHSAPTPHYAPHARAPTSSHLGEPPDGADGLSGLRVRCVSVRNSKVVIRYDTVAGVDVSVRPRNYRSYCVLRVVLFSSVVGTAARNIRSDYTTRLHYAKCSSSSDNCNSRQLGSSDLWWAVGSLLLTWNLSLFSCTSLR